MSFEEATIGAYRRHSKSHASQKTAIGWQRVRDYEKQQMGRIYPETGTFFTDDNGMAIDWEGEHQLEITSSGSYRFAVDTGAFGTSVVETDDWNQVASYLDSIFAVLQPVD